MMPMRYGRRMLGVAVEAMNKIGAEAADIAAIGITTRERRQLYGIKRPEIQFIMRSYGSAAGHLIL